MSFQSWGSCGAFLLLNSSSVEAWPQFLHIHAEQFGELKNKVEEMDSKLVEWMLHHKTTCEAMRLSEVYQLLWKLSWFFCLTLEWNKEKFYVSALTVISRGEDYNIPKPRITLMDRTWASMCLILLTKYKQIPDKHLMPTQIYNICR